MSILPTDDGSGATSFVSVWLAAAALDTYTHLITSTMTTTTAAAAAAAAAASQVSPLFQDSMAPGGDLVVSTTILAADAREAASNALSSSSSSSSWRQYVPLVVSVGVLLDIVLGSPAANGLLKTLSSSSSGGGGGGATTKTSRNERIDSMAVAKQALEKAEATKELRRFLDENQSEWQKIAAQQRAVQDQLAAYDRHKQQQQQQQQQLQQQPQNQQNQKQQLQQSQQPPQSQSPMKPPPFNKEEEQDQRQE